MANEEVIRQQMEETRTSLTEKLETLENQVVQTVQGATEAVSDTVATIKDSVQETVTSVKDSVDDTVSAVKDTVSGSVETAKEYMDVRGYVAEYPWLMMGASVAAGFALGTLLGRRDPMAPLTRPSETARGSDGPARPHHRNGGQHRRREEKPEASWLGEFAPEITKLKGMALGALLGTAREMIAKSMPGHMGQHLSQIVDNITTKLGGEPMSHSDWESMQKAGGYSSEGERYESRHETEMGGSVGATRRQGPQTMGRFDR